MFPEERCVPRGTLCSQRNVVFPEERCVPGGTLCSQENVVFSGNVEYQVGTLWP